MATPGEDEPPQRPPSPPQHLTFSARGLHPPTFSAFKPREYRISSSHPIAHVAWNCDGRKLAGVGMDKMARVWSPEKSMDMRMAVTFSGAHSDDVDYVSWNPTHPELFCTSSSRDRRIAFWDARQSRSTQQINLKVSPITTCYSPTGRHLLYTSHGNSIYFMAYDRGESAAAGSPEQWRLTENDAQLPGSAAIFNNTGDGIILTHTSEHTVRVLDFPSLSVRETPPAHVAGAVCTAIDPRGRYLASGGHDSIVNLFDMQEWICARTITDCDASINALSFSHDGEFLAIASAAPHIEICGVETGTLLHRVSAPGASSTVSWNPSKHVIAYCGTARGREGAAPISIISLFGLLE